MIEVDALTVTFGRTIALDNVSLKIEPGVTGLFGPNGSGKSTLIRALAGLLRPARGEIKIDGAPVDLRDESFRQLVGFAGHEAGLYADLSVRENLALFGKLYGIANGRGSDVIEELGLGASADTTVGSLSAGMKRRVAVGRALLHEPRLLLLDEPYANLDTEAADLVSAAVQRWSTGNRVGIVASHGAKRVKAYASAGVVLRDGRLAAQGTYEKRFERL